MKAGTCTPKMTKAASNIKKRRQVSFNQVEIVELPYTIGDGPANGTPVTVQWEAQDRTAFRLDFFEQYRPKRRSQSQLRLSPESRSQKLLRSGHTWEEICEGANNAAQLRKERTTSIQQIYALQQMRNLSKRISNRENEIASRKHHRFHGVAANNRVRAARVA